MQLHASSAAGHPLRALCAWDQHCLCTETGTGERKQATIKLTPFGVFTLTVPVKQDVMLGLYGGDHLVTSERTELTTGGTGVSTCKGAC